MAFMYPAKCPPPFDYPPTGPALISLPRPIISRPTTHNPVYPPLKLVLSLGQPQPSLSSTQARTIWS
ncbi:hypothetical protein CY34DRAFT_15268 [Suillus luteus UH-Slu-Lm8-n1]|uniref:Uncharacterized protein n=1 Tax=Suillus luteus UH-Slu-Lm8-n1 TaxID=930992 RepID=A0A0D0AJ06_9AGAM|nr:hypothetical protein CY34DRAFT_15268 [Suillus luteus UH-Slu-Lm8-n1]